MQDRGWFSPPVALALEARGGRTTQVNNVHQAAEVLLYQWPVTAGPKHMAARRTCLEAMSGKRTAAEARQALIEAAEEAELLRATLAPSSRSAGTKRQRRRG